MIWIFRVEVWDDADVQVIELIALANNMAVARGAYEAAKMRPRSQLPGCSRLRRARLRLPRRAAGQAPARASRPRSRRAV